MGRSRTSTRAGRKPEGDGTPDRRGGNIHARGEETSTSKRKTDSPTEHPRARGGNLRVSSALRSRSGTSTRAGRKLINAAEEQDRGGNIHARGEEPLAQDSGEFSSVEHPRARGGTSHEHPLRASSVGASLRAGRNPGIHRLQDDTHGNIHTRGEEPQGEQDAKYLVRSSPARVKIHGPLSQRRRGMGTSSGARRNPRAARPARTTKNIYARWEASTRSRRSQLHQWEHPRAWGGTLRRRRHLGERSIHARGGTADLPRVPLLAGGASPRAGRNRGGGARAGQGGGSIPARGEEPAYVEQDILYKEHPRARGGTSETAQCVEGKQGASPRAGRNQR